MWKMGWKNEMEGFLLSSFDPFALLPSSFHFIWFYFILFININKGMFLIRQQKIIFFIALFSYLISFEVLDRMTRTSPYIPYELGKYFLVLMGITGICFSGIRSKNGILMALLVTPAVFYDSSGKREFFDIINYYLAPLKSSLALT